MNPTTFEDQFETVGPSTMGCQFRQRFNILDLLGLDNCGLQTDCRIEKAIPPEEENYRRLFIDLKRLRKP